MRIGIDARLNAYRGGGIPQYTYQLMRALSSVAPRHEIISLQHVRHTDVLVAAPNVQRGTFFTPPHHRFEQWSLSLEVLRWRLDVLHCPDFIIPRYCTVPTVVTIHDLAFLHFPDILDDDARRYYGQVRHSVQRADAIIAVSHATRNDIVELLDMDAERIDVVYEAADPLFLPRSIAPGEKRTIGSKASDTHTLEAGTFGLFVSTLEPRKNLSTLLRAFRICLNREPNAKYRLVVAGGRGWYDETIFNDVRDLGLGNMVVFVGQVSSDELVWLYNACRLYANPSLYEGFGLPAVEAMACGAPTIVSDGGSLPEVVGDAALCIPSQDVEAWADALERVWYDEALQEQLRNVGPIQSAHFSWERAARETLEVYRRVVHR